MKRSFLWGIALVLLVAVAVGTFLFMDADNRSIRIQWKEYSLTGSSLNLNSLGIGDDEIADIRSRIQSAGSIETLYLWGNRFTAKGLGYIAWLQNNALRVIDISNSAIGDVGMREFLGKSPFRVVDVSGNTLTDASVQDISHNGKLSYLTINRNGIQDGGFQKILENTRIEYLSIENNLLTDASIEYLRKNKDALKIQYLRLKWNNFSAEGIKKLDELNSQKAFKTLEY